MAGLSIHHPWAFTFGILGNLISFMVYLAPLPTFYRVYRKKSTEGFQSVPYVVALFSATLWIFYALLKDDACLLITINSVGCVIETAYIVVFFIYAPKAAKIFTANLVAGVNMGMFGVILLLTLLLSEGSKRVEVLGWICMIFSVCVFVAPLSVIRLVIRTKSVEYMPFWLSFFLTLTAIVWFAYGLLTKDVYVALPNVLGFGFGVLQMLLYIVYKESKKVVVVAVERKEVPERAAVPMAKLGMEKLVELYPDAEMSPSAEEGRQQEYTVLNMANINREVILVQKLDQLDEEDQSNEEEEEEEGEEEEEEEEEEVNKNIRNLEV